MPNSLSRICLISLTSCLVLISLTSLTHVISLSLSLFHLSMSNFSPLISVRRPAGAVCSQGMSAKEFEDALEWLYSMLLRTTVPTHTKFLTLQDDAQTAVAVWVPPGVEVSEWDFIKAGGYAFVWKYAGWQRRQRYLGYGDVVKMRRMRLMRPYDQKYYYLMAFGAKPSSSGAAPTATSTTTTTLTPRLTDNAGAVAVVRAVLDQADAAQLPCIVETAVSAEVDLYQSLGFETVEEFSLFGVVVYMLMRAPASKR